MSRSQQTFVYSGPLPPPEELQKYDKIVEGGAERIFNQFEKQTAHRHEIEKLIATAGIKNEKIGLILGFILALLALGFAIILVLMGKETLALISFLIEFLGIVAIFVYDRHYSKKKIDRRGKLVF